MFSTTQYKGGYIHTTNTGSGETVSYQLPGDYVRWPAKSFRAAQLAITEYIKQQQRNSLPVAEVEEI